MEYLLQLFQASAVLLLLIMGILAVLLLFKVLLSFWVFPIRAHKKLLEFGFSGPTPRFPLGNTAEMKMMKKKSTSSEDSSIFSPSINAISHDIHSTALPHFSHWQKSYGKVYVYWLGTEPFLYIAEPEFLKDISSRVPARSWGKPDVFKEDRKPMFGQGLPMVEGDNWTRHRHIITPALSPSNLKGMTSVMVEMATAMADRWAARVNSGNPEIDVVGELVSTTGGIIAKTGFGVADGQETAKVLQKLGAMQLTLFKSNRYVGVPFGYLICPRVTSEANKLGREIDSLLLSIISQRRASAKNEEKRNDLLAMLMEGEDRRESGGRLTARELVDECKTFFFGGQESTALALMWTMMLLGQHTEWQEILREEIREVVGDMEIDYSVIASLKKMGWVMNEVLRLYPTAPNAQRQVRSDVAVGKRVVPKGTNIWIDIVAMHHDEELWGPDVHQFRPERFDRGGPHGGCRHKMGFMPFGFGGRMCVGRNLAATEYKVVLTVLLRRFSFSLSPSYKHSPSYMLSLRPGHGMPLVFRQLAEA